VKSSEADIELLEQFLRDDLDESSKVSLLSRLKVESELAEDFAFIQNIRKGASANRLSEKLTFVQSLEDEMVNETPTKEVSIFGKVKWIAVAASLLLIAGTVWWYSNGNGSSNESSLYAELIDQKFDDEFILHTTKRAIKQEMTLSPEQQRAYEMYSIKLFDESSPLLLDLWEKQKDTLALFYHGVAEMAKGNKEMGEKIFSHPALEKYQEQIAFFKQ
jgi:hypothetical protein